MKLIAKVLFAVVLLNILFLQTSAAVPDKIRVYVNGNELVFTDARPFRDAGGSVLIPVRALAGALGCDFSWDSDTQTVLLTRGRVSVELTVGKSEISVLGVRRPMNTAAVVQAGRTFVPVRFAAEAFGATVVWDYDTQTVSITDGRKAVYKLDEVEWDIEVTDVLENNSDGFLTLIKESGLILDERRVGKNERKVVVIKITVDDPGTDVDKQREQADTLLRQYLGGELADEIMDYAAKKEDGDTVIERKYFETERYGVYATGYIGPVILYLYL